MNDREASDIIVKLFDHVEELIIDGYDIVVLRVSRDDNGDFIIKVNVEEQ